MNCQASGSWSIVPTCLRKIRTSYYPVQIKSVTLFNWPDFMCVSLYTSAAVPCGDPPTIPNGSRTFTVTTFGGTATYTCNTGYQLSGSSTVTCQASGSWSTVPTCRKNLDHNHQFSDFNNSCKYLYSYLLWHPSEHS